MLSRVRKKIIVLCMLGVLNVNIAHGDLNTTTALVTSDDNVTLTPPSVMQHENKSEVIDNEGKYANITEDYFEGTPTINQKTTDGNTVTHLNSSDIQILNFPHNLQIISEVLKNLKNHECVRDTTMTLEGMTRHERWALEMFDSFPKFPVGILYGNYYQLGNFDECVGVTHSFQDEDAEVRIQGQYCLADIHFKRKNNGRFARSSQDDKMKPNRYKFNNTVIHWGICLPSSCSTDDAEVFVHEIFSSAVENFEVILVKIESNKCYYESSPPITRLETVYGCIIGILVIFAIMATGYHCWYMRKRKTYVTYNVDSLRTKHPKLFQEILICFSCINTIEKFLRIKPNELNLECLCGIKFLSMSLIIVGHSLIFILGGPIANKDFFKEISTKLENGPFLNNALLVDTFLLVSGFLMCRLLLIELEKRKGKINIFILYIARYMRLTPAYIVIIGLYTTFLYRTGTGPFWKSRIELEKQRCLKSWWTNILYINNYVNTEYMCMFQSWYLAVDYHMFIISPIIIYPLWKWKRIGLSLLVFCTIISVGIPFWITYRDKLDPTLMAYPPEITDISENFYFINVYIKTHIRSSSYFIGLSFGYLVHKLQCSGAKISPYIIWTTWTATAILSTMSMYTIVIFYDENHMVSCFESAIYSALHRVAWCLAIGWIIVACITDNAAIINKFLSWKLFIPASRLTYCAYLANGLVVVFNAGVLRQPMYISKYELACKILGHLMLTYALAFVLCIFFESPIHGLEKLLLRSERIKEQKYLTSTTLRPVEET